MISSPHSKLCNAAQRKTSAARRLSWFRSTARHSIRSWAQEKVRWSLSPCIDLSCIATQSGSLVICAASVNCVALCCLTVLHRVFSLASFCAMFLVCVLLRRVFLFTYFCSVFVFLLRSFHCALKLFHSLSLFDSLSFSTPSLLFGRSHFGILWLFSCFNQAIAFFQLQAIGHSFISTFTRTDEVDWVHEKLFRFKIKMAFKPDILKSLCLRWYVKTFTKLPVAEIFNK